MSVNYRCDFCGEDFHNFSSWQFHMCEAKRNLLYHGQDHRGENTQCQNDPETSDALKTSPDTTGSR